MIEFESLEKGYIFEGSDISDKKPKLRLAVLLILFVLMIGFFIKNDYNFNFFRDKNKIIPEFKCSEEDMLVFHDSRDANYKRAKTALSKNTSLIESEKNFESSRILFEEELEVDRAKPVINLYFSGDTNLEIPNRMCGFKINVFYK